MGTALFAAPLPADEHRPSDSSAIRDELLRRWERSRRVDVAFREVTRRTAGDGDIDGAAAVDDARVAQRMPDRVVTGGGSVSAILDGRAIGCVTAVEGEARCHDAGPADGEGALGAELRRLRAATQGPGADYRLSELGGGCYRLRLVGDSLRPAFGRRLDVCFEERTGVARREASVVGDVIATTVRTGVRPVRDADLALPAPVS